MHTRSFSLLFGLLSSRQISGSIKMSSSSDQIDSLESVLESKLGGTAELAEVKRILYGRQLPHLDLPPTAIKRAEELDFQLAGYAFDQAAIESTRPPRKGKHNSD